MILRFPAASATMLMTELCYYALQEGDFHPTVFLFCSEATFRQPVMERKLPLLQFSIFLGIVMVGCILELTMTMLCRCCSVILSTLSSFLRVDLCCTSWYLLDNLCQLSAAFQSLPIQRTRFYHKNYGIFLYFCYRSSDGIMLQVPQPYAARCESWKQDWSAYKLHLQFWIAGLCSIHHHI